MDQGRGGPPRKLRIPQEVAALIRGLHPVLKRKVRAALQALLDDPYAGKALRNELRGLRSYRVGRFRIIYRLGPNLELVAFGPRDSIYVETYRQLHEPRGRYRTRNLARSVHSTSAGTFGWSDLHTCTTLHAGRAVRIPSCASSPVPGL